MLGGSIVWGLRAIINEPSAWGLLCWLAHAVASYCCSCCGVAGLRKRWQPLLIVFGPRPVSLTTAHLLDHHSTTTLAGQFFTILGQAVPASSNFFM